MTPRPVRGSPRSLASVVRRDVVEAARLLVGAVLATEVDGSEVTLVITETEAYRIDDPASHSYGGRTARNAVMFSDPGRLYVYRSYGLHWCANVVTEPPGSAVLLRSAIARSGLPIIVRRRGRTDHLADGPGKLAQAAGITGADDGLDLFDSERVRLTPAERSIPTRTATRVGVSRAADRPWRFISAS